MRSLTRTYDQFIPEFLCTIFASGDQVRVAVLHGVGDIRARRTGRTTLRASRASWSRSSRTVALTGS